MIKTIWYMCKPGDTRDYVMTTPPSEAWAEAMHEQGFKLFECLVHIPLDIKLAGCGDQVATAAEAPLVPQAMQAVVEPHCVHCGSTELQRPTLKHKEGCVMHKLMLG